MKTVEDLDLLIRGLHDKGALHARRGFCLRDIPPSMISCHVIEEAVELQAEILNEGPAPGAYKRQIWEAADMLAAFLHLLYVAGIPLKEVTRRAEECLLENFTLNPAEVQTSTPGCARSNRALRESQR